MPSIINLILAEGIIKSMSYAAFKQGRYTGMISRKLTYWVSPG
jgi:hypothetical protein